jgi:hypothetical protein
VTTVDTAAAWRVEKPITLAALAAFFAFGLAGCGTSNNLLGSTEAPTKVATPGASPAVTQQAKVAIAPVIGAPDAIAKQLQGQLGTALDQKGIGTVKITDKAEFTLRGYIVSAREKAGTKVSYIWDVTDPAGKRVNRITGEELVAGAPGKDPWASVNAQLTQSIADKTAGSLATWLPSHKSAAVASSGGTGTASAGAQAAPSTMAVASADPAAASAPAPSAPANEATGSIGRDAGVSAVAPVVSGAPGDGDTSLASALQRELSRSGVALADKPIGPAYRVEGKVSLGEGKDGKQPITIDWHVKDPQGKKLGTVTQKNEIPQGSLDGAWGKTADAAAAAAAQGIIKLLPQAKAVN